MGISFSDLTHSSNSH